MNLPNAGVHLGACCGVLEYEVLGCGANMATAMGWADAPWRASAAEADALEKVWMEKKVKLDNEKVGSCGLRNEQIALIQKTWKVVETLPTEVVGCVSQPQSGGLWDAALRALPFRAASRFSPCLMLSMQTLLDRNSCPQRAAVQAHL
jgi:hypothetical protein